MLYTHTICIHIVDEPNEEIPLPKPTQYLKSALFSQSSQHGGGAMVFLQSPWQHDVNTPAGQ